MRYLFFILLLFPFLVQAQGTTVQGTPTTRVWNKGFIQMDSGFVVSPRDTTFWYTWKPDLVRLAANGKLYYFDGTYYQEMGFDPTDIYNTLDEKVNILDTADMLVNYKGAYYQASFNNATRALTLTRLNGTTTVLSIPEGGGGTSPTDLSIGTVTGTTVDVNSSTGTGATIPAANTTDAGVLTAALFNKLMGIEDNANNYIHPLSGVTPGTYTKVTVNAEGHVTATASLAASDIPNLPISKITNLQTTLDGKQTQLNGTGLVRMSGTTVTYDNTFYATGITSGAIGSLFNVGTGISGNTLTLSYSAINQNANLAYLSPNGSSGAPSWRKIVGSDIASNTIELSNIQSFTGPILIGKSSATPGSLEQITIGANLSLIGGVLSGTSSGGSGTVTSFGVTNNTGLLTTSVSNPNTTPNLTLGLATTSANIWFGNASGSTQVPGFNSIGTFSITNDANITASVTSGSAASLLRNMGITLSWNGILPISRGGLNLSALGSPGQSLRVNGAGTGYEFYTPTSGGTLTDVTVSGFSPLFTVSKAGTSAHPTFTFNTINQSAGTFYGGPTAGVGGPGFRRLVGTDFDNAIIPLSAVQNISSGIILGRYSSGTGPVQGLTFNPSHFSVDGSGQISAISSGGSGVTSVKIAASNALSVTPNTAQTGVADFTLNWTGLNTEYVAGNGARIAFPTIPSVGNGSISIGTSGIATGSLSFTANQGTNTSGTINVPGTNLGSSVSGNNVTVTSSTGTSTTFTVPSGGATPSWDAVTTVGNRSASSIIVGDASPANGSGGRYIDVNGSEWNDGIAAGVRLNQFWGTKYALKIDAISRSQAAVGLRIATSQWNGSIAQEIEALFVESNGKFRFSQHGGSGVEMATLDANGNLGRAPIPGGGSGVTSVNVAGSNALTFTGGPVTTSGTITAAWSGNTSQYIRGDGSTAPFPSIPTVNNSTIAIGGTGIATGGASFTLNQSSGSTIAINVPGTDIGASISGNTLTLTSSTGTGASVTLPGSGGSQTLQQTTTLGNTTTDNILLTGTANFLGRNNNTSLLTLVGGNSASYSAGGIITLYGASHSTNAGKIIIAGGAAANGSIELATSGTKRFEILSGGTINLPGFSGTGDRPIGVDGSGNLKVLQNGGTGSGTISSTTNVTVSSSNYTYAVMGNKVVVYVSANITLSGGSGGFLLDVPVTKTFTGGTPRIGYGTAVEDTQAPMVVSVTPNLSSNKVYVDVRQTGSVIPSNSRLIVFSFMYEL